MNTLLTMTTLPEAVDYLVNKIHVDAVYAKVAVDQAFNYGHGDLLCKNVDSEPSAMSEYDILMQYQTFCDMMVKTADGIEIDGSLLYDLQGNPIYETVNLQNYLWEHSEDGEEYECNESDVIEFISNKVDNDDLSGSVIPEEIEVTTEVAEAMLHEFKIYLQQK